MFYLWLRELEFGCSGFNSRRTGVIEKAPPKRGLRCTGFSRKGPSAAGQFATRELVPERKAPPDDGAKDSHLWGYTKGHSIQTPPVHIRGPTRPNWGWKLER